jgi:two-component system heavy metal sensor histidine kinase CusS
MLGRLEDSFNRLSRFSADLAHELRTPIHNLMGEAEVALSRTRSSEDYREVLESSLEEGQRLSRMIDSLLFLARAENAETRLEFSLVNVRNEMQAVVDYYDAVIAENQLEVHCEGQARLMADSILLRRALTNLLSNAVRHTPASGRITLSARETANGAAEISVTDSGPGIPAAHLPRVFDRFYRIDPARAHSEKGTGLGLAIVKSIMELHGGTVTVESGPGRGTTACLHFPARPATAGE